ncbi:MAG: MFS transporter [Anaerolineales bacterium]|nr:MFS transporter [Anaerolineales bacterium]
MQQADKFPNQTVDERLSQSTTTALSRHKRIGRWVLAATIIGSSIAFIDSTVINVALPALQADLNATVFQVQWIVEIYVLFMAALILVGGATGDQFGRRFIYALGITLFAASSLWCGFARDVSHLLWARAVQGIGGALLVPGSLAIIGAYFKDEERGKAIGTWSAFSALTTALGPVLGGWLVENVSWRWVFFFNIPLCVVVVFILYWRVPESRDETATGGLDWLGALLATVGLGGITYGLIEAGFYGFDHPLVILGLVGGAMALVAFGYVEAKSPSPMVPLQLFHSRTFTGANILTFTLYAGLGGLLFFMPFNFIQVQGYSATATGAAFLPFVLIIFLLSRWAGGLADRYGFRGPLIVGTLLAAVGFALFALPGVGGSYWTTFFPGIAVLGVSMAISAPPLAAAALGSVEKRYSGTASGINNAVSRVAGLLAIAILGLFVLGSFNRHLDRDLAELPISPEVQTMLDQERVKLAGAEIPPEVNGELRLQLEQAIDQAFVAGFRMAMLAGAGLCLLSALAAALLIETKDHIAVTKAEDTSLHL